MGSELFIGGLTGEASKGRFGGLGRPAPLREERSEGQSFGELLVKKIEQLEELQQRADTLTRAYAAGEPVELEEVVMAITRAELALNLAVEVRNRVVEAYQELARMPI